MNQEYNALNLSFQIYFDNLTLCESEYTDEKIGFSETKESFIFMTIVLTLLNIIQSFFYFQSKEKVFLDSIKFELPGSYSETFL